MYCIRRKNNFKFLLNSLLTLLCSGTGAQFTSTLSLLWGLVWELKNVEQVCSAPKLIFFILKDCQIRNYS